MLSQHCLKKILFKKIFKVPREKKWFKFQWHFSSKVELKNPCYCPIWLSRAVTDFVSCLGFSFSRMPKMFIYVREIWDLNASRHRGQYSFLKFKMLLRLSRPIPRKQLRTDKALSWDLSPWITSGFSTKKARQFIKWKLFSAFDLSFVV